MTILFKLLQGDGLNNCKRARLDITNGNPFLFQGYEFEVVGFEDRNTLRRGIETMIKFGNGKLVNNTSFTNKDKFYYITYGIYIFLYRFYFRTKTSRLFFNSLYCSF